MYYESVKLDFLDVGEIGLWYLLIIYVRLLVSSFIKSILIVVTNIKIPQLMATIGAILLTKLNL